MLDVLLVDDEPLIRLSVGDGLRDAGHRVALASDGAEALALLEREVFDVVISDIRLPKVDGMEVFRRITTQLPQTDVILITGYGAVSDAVSALKQGAHDYLTKPFEVEEIVVRLERIAEARTLRRELEQARSALGQKSVGVQIIGQSPPMVRLMERIDAFAGSEASVLITGDSGTGKELVAQALHFGSERANRPFVAVNCASFPETLLEAELFGHERGAFTGATKRRDGRFKAADGGTLLLDEVAEIPASAQAKLLRVLQERAVEPLGTNRAVKVDVRILAATHRNLKERIESGQFREDLYYRLNVLQLEIPPLRERRSDIPLLIDHILKRIGAKDNPPSITDRALMALSTYSYPGNVRELEHALQHGVILARKDPIDLAHLPDPIRTQAQLDGVASNSASISEILPLSAAAKAFERGHLIRAMKTARGKRIKGAKLLGISRKNLWEKLRSHGLTDSDWRD